MTPNLDIALARTDLNRILYQKPRPDEYQQCFRIRDVRISRIISYLSATNKLRKEQLGLYGNELNYMTTAWTVGYGNYSSHVIELTY